MNMNMEWASKFGLPPLKGLDEMAAQDEYIHSDSLLVKRQQDDDDDDDDVENQREETLPLKAAMDYLEGATAKSTPTNRLSIPLNDNKNDDDNDLEHDPVFSFMKQQQFPQQGALSSRSSSSSMGVLEMESSDHCDTSDHAEASPQKPGKHRFLQDLDDRLAKKNTPSRSSSVRVTLSKNNSSNNSNNPSTVKRWLSFGLGGSTVSENSNNSTINNNNSSSSQKPPHESAEKSGTDENNLPPLSRQRLQPKRSTSLQKNSPDSYDVVTSTNMLDADELLALEQMKQLKQDGHESLFTAEGLSTRFKELIQSHPREAFIALTLILSVLAYFFLKSNEDEGVG